MVQGSYTLAIIDKSNDVHEDPWQKMLAAKRCSGSSCTVACHTLQIARKLAVGKTLFMLSTLHDMPLHAIQLFTYIMLSYKDIRSKVSVDRNINAAKFSQQRRSRLLVSGQKHSIINHPIPHSIASCYHNRLREN